MSSTALSVMHERIIPDGVAGFFKPISSNCLDQLIWQYQSAKKSVETFYSFLDGQGSFGLSYAIRVLESSRGITLPSTVGSLDEALAFLDADYWRRALALTDVYEHMPAERRHEWDALLRERKDSEGNRIPSFSEDVVYSSIKDLIFSRDQFLSERVAGIFKNLSGEHITNAPQGFGRRFIMNHVCTNFDFLSICYEKRNYIHDLRFVINKFLNRGCPEHLDTGAVLRHAFKNETGQWVDVDGGAFRIRGYKKGTLHIEVHEDIAWRLNEILAVIYGKSIPESFRRKPKKDNKKGRLFDFHQTLLPASVVSVLAQLEPARSGVVKNGRMTGWKYHPNAVSLPSNYRLGRGIGEDTIDACRDVLLACGGVKVNALEYQFDYDFLRDVRDELVVLGALPEKVSHQFYPTPPALAARVVDMADIKEHHSCLEPQAGQGAIATLMPSGTTCVEVSRLHCEILKAKGIGDIHCADFLVWAKTAPRFDRICCNPPFSKGRARTHLAAAAELLNIEGVMTAVVPSGMAFSHGLDTNFFSVQSSSPISGAFKDASIDVVILTIRRNR